MSPLCQKESEIQKYGLNIGILVLKLFTHYNIKAGI